MSKKKKGLLALLGLLFALVLWDVWVVFFHTPGWRPTFVSTSPDGRFTVSGYRNESIFSFRLFIVMMPGQGGGGAGTVVLRDTRTGKVLRRERTDYVDSGTPPVDWYMEYNEVGMSNVGVWSLPTD